MERFDDGNLVNEVGKSFSVPSFLRKAFTDALRDNDDGLLDHKLFGIVVRAVLFESGFVEIDPELVLFKYDNFNAQGIFYYSLPNIVSRGNTEYVKVVFQNLGKHCKVYGFLINGTWIHSMLFDKVKLPILNVVWPKIGQVVEEKEVFEFWRKMKDGLALPLLIDLCEKTGLELPPCFIKLPIELKLKILESVSGVDIANVSCVCSELRQLALNDYLWRKKYIKEFGNAVLRNWETFKDMFARACKIKRMIARTNAQNIDSHFMRRRNAYVDQFHIGRSSRRKILIYADNSFDIRHPFPQRYPYPDDPFGNRWRFPRTTSEGYDDGLFPYQGCPGGYTPFGLIFILVNYSRKITASNF
ncbi:F-box protein SKIP22-like protein [Tanacetum coccineum]